MVKKVSLPRAEMRARVDASKMSWSAIIDIFSSDLVAAEKRVAELSSVKNGSGMRIAKKLAMSRLLLQGRIAKLDQAGDGEKARFFVDLVKLLRNTESLLEAYDDELAIWRQFLNVMIQKMKHERLIVSKQIPENRLEVLGKWKEVDPHELV